MSLETIKLLETKIADLLVRYDRMRKANEASQQRIRENEKQLAEVVGKLRQLEKEREEVKGRVEKVLTRLDGLDLG